MTAAVIDMRTRTVREPAFDERTAKYMCYLMVELRNMIREYDKATLVMAALEYEDMMPDDGDFAFRAELVLHATGIR